MLRIQKYRFIFLFMALVSLAVFKIACKVQDIPREQPLLITKLFPGSSTLTVTAQGAQMAALFFNVFNATPYATVECSYVVSNLSTPNDVYASLYLYFQLDQNGAGTLNVNNVLCGSPGSTPTAQVNWKCRLAYPPYAQSAGSSISTFECLT